MLTQAFCGFVHLVESLVVLVALLRRAALVPFILFLLFIHYFLDPLILFSSRRSLLLSRQILEFFLFGMGNLIWHKYSRIVSIASSVYAIWASFWGLFYRKFFWDFIGGTLQNPGGIEPSPKVAVFIAIIVNVPIIQILTMVIAAIILCIELPLPLIKTLSLYRILVLRIVLLIFQACLCLLFYQGTNAAIWSLISVICYGRAVALGERIQEAKGSRGKGGDP